MNMNIAPLQPAEWQSVFERVVAFLPEDERAERVQHCVYLLEIGKLDPRGIWVARAGGAIVGVQVCVPLAGAACLFWLPIADGDVADSLVHAGLTWCRSAGVKIAQAFVAPAEMSGAQPLLRQGFRRMTRMHQLQHYLVELPMPAPTTLTFEPFRAERYRDFAATLERTYHGTLDCPELNGIRTVDEIIAGHQGEGKFDPNCWWLTRDGAAPVGVLMLAELEDASGWELSYVGIVPEQRRRGHGRAMLAHALACAHERLAARLIIAVDGRNAPALALYEAAGFVEYECHEVLLQLLT